MRLALSANDGLFIRYAAGLLAVFCLLSVTSPTSSAAEHSEGSATSPHYRGGISLTLQSKFSAQDVKKISNWGANLIRLAIHANPNHKSYGVFFLPMECAFMAERTQ